MKKIEKKIRRIRKDNKTTKKRLKEAVANLRDIRLKITTDYEKLIY